LKKATEITKPKSLTMCDKIAKILRNLKDKKHYTMQV